jgi:hypothetical protein
MVFSVTSLTFQLFIVGRLLERSKLMSGGQDLGHCGEEEKDSK